METADAPLRTATSTAQNRSARLFEFASTRTMVACGAMACAHSTSRAISAPQLEFAAGLRPVAYTFRNQPFALVQAGRLNWRLNTPRSASILGSS